MNVVDASTDLAGKGPCMDVPCEMPSETVAHVNATAEETRHGEEWSFVEASPSGQDLAQQIAENDCPSDDNGCSSSDGRRCP